MEIKQKNIKKIVFYFLCIMVIIFLLGILFCYYFFQPKVFIEYYNNWQKQSQWSYKIGAKHWKWKYWYKNWQQKSIWKYNIWEKIWIWRYYKSNGRIIKKENCEKNMCKKI